MLRALHPLFFWAIGCALLSGGVAILIVLCNAWIGQAAISAEQIRSGASFGALFGALTGLLISYLRGSNEEPPIHQRQRSFDIITLTLIALLLGSTFYWMLMR